MDPAVRIRFFVVLFLLGLVLVLSVPVAVDEVEDFLQVSFLSVGQGDAIYIVTPDGFDVLIDGGATNKVLRELAEKKAFFDREIDLVIATHPDTDHIGGLVDVLNRYEVNTILLTNNQSETAAATSFMQAVASESAEVRRAIAGQVIVLGASTSIRILSPTGDSTDWPSNASSIIVQVVYGDVEFMLTGDAPIGVENYVVGKYGPSLQSEVLKLGHHGSKTSTSQQFIEAVSPGYAVVSAGADNRYGHPNIEVVERIEDFGARILSTVSGNSVDLVSDGQTVWEDK